MSVPNNPGDRQKLKLMLVEMTHCFGKMDSEREQLKEIKKEIKQTFDIAPKMANKIAKAMYLMDFADQQAENEEFEFMFQALEKETKLQVV